jgi:hypothetical protein
MFDKNEILINNQVLNDFEYVSESVINQNPSDESKSDSLNEFVYGFCGDCFSFLNKFTCVSEKSEHDYSMNIELLPSGIHQNAFPVLQWTSTVHCTQYNLYMYYM